MTQQQSETLETIEGLLSSPDIEMVSLGAKILSVSFHPNMWPNILNKHCKEEQKVTFMTGGYTFVLPTYDKWQWRIKCINRRKKTHELEIIGPQEYFSTTFTTTNAFIAHTGQGGMQMLQRAYAGYNNMNKLKTNKYEQSKINKINKGRTRTTFK